MRQAYLLAASGLLWLAPCAAVAQPAPMASYWPHEDGRSWFYDQHFENLAEGGTVDNVARLRFDGTTVAAGGIAAQVLTGSVASLPAARTTSSPDVPAEVKSPLLRRLWRARPDLRAGILRTTAVEPCPTGAIDGWEALLLAGGFAWTQTASEVAAWRCNLASTRSWLWLISDLSPGSTATIPLVPDLADDVTLKLTVLGLEDATVPGGTFEDCLHVDYVLDYGVSECTSPTGEPLGSQRYETKGFVRYAPDVGPIESFEEFVVTNLTGSCPGATGPVARATLKLNAPSVPAKPSSWGRIKSAYRQ
jgi:hypothetical protein